MLQHKSKEISVIIPCYNASPYIDKCIQSLLNQTINLDKMELIFVNDASEDDTWEILQKYEEQYTDCIILINLSQNSKQGTARNIGIKYAQGKYIGFCDSDDYVEPDMYEKLYEKMLDTDADYVACQMYVEKEERLLQISGPNSDTVLDMEKEEYKNMICDIEVNACIVQCLYKREFLERANVLFPEKLTYEDNFFAGILNYYVKKIGLIKKPLYHYDIHSVSTIHTSNACHHLDRLKIEIMKLEELKRRGLFETYKEDIEASFVILYFANTINILMTRFDEIPEGIIFEMQKTVKEYFPNWKDNILLKYYVNPSQQVKYLLIDYPFKKGDKEEISLAMKLVASRLFR